MDQDIKPLSEVKIRIANVIKQVHDTPNLWLLRSMEKVLLFYWMLMNNEDIQDKHELLTDVQVSLDQLENGQGVTHEDAKENVLKNVPNMTQ